MISPRIAHIQKTVRHALSQSNRLLVPIVDKLQTICKQTNYRYRYSTNCIRRLHETTGRSNELIDAHRICSRGLIKVTGVDSGDFLQGLITNDIQLLKNECKSIYSFVLNLQGRVRYDAFIYSLGDDGTYLIDCDKRILKDFISELFKYKIRKKVKLSVVTEEFNSWALFTTGSKPLLERISNLYNGNERLLVQDPRVKSFGSRLLLPVDTQLDSVFNSSDYVESDEHQYHVKRLQWGLPEGTEDLPVAECLPLESNLIYMNGVSFDKGCYLGQELTARTHHTGVTRKRLMPVEFCCDDPDVAASNSVVLETGKSVGKFRSRRGKYGLALLRISDLKGNVAVKNAKGNLYPVTAITPHWWPQDQK